MRKTPGPEKYNCQEKKLQSYGETSNGLCVESIGNFNNKTIPKGKRNAG